MPAGNCVSRPAGAHPVRPRGSPPQSVASLATGVATGLAKRRHASGWAMGRRPRNLDASRRPRGLHDLKATTTPASLGRGGARLRRGVRPGHARRGRPRTLGGPRLASRSAGGAESRCSVSDARRVCGPTGRRPPGHRPSVRLEAGRRPGEAEPRLQGAGESEGGRRARTFGERGGVWPRPRPGGPCWCALQEGHCRREPSPMPRHGQTGHRDLGREWNPAPGRVATRHSNGRAGWWTSPGPDLARSRGGNLPAYSTTHFLRHTPQEPSGHVPQALRRA